MATGGLTMACGLLVLLVIHAAIPTSSSASLKVGFYRRPCPDAEAIVKEVVNRAAAKDSGVAPGLIRMHFHDCFVRGCDASVLLDPTSEGNRVEKQSPANFPSLRGFEVIDEAKAILESTCPGTVSCADILAFAARDASYVAGGIDYDVPAGRRDGRVSMESETLDNLPGFDLTADKLVERFAKKGLSAGDMVALSGAHSIGISHCSSFSKRLYDFNSTHKQDPSMDPAFADYLRRRCPPSSDGSASSLTVPMDVATPDSLDNQYYRNLQKYRGLLTSDQTLESSSSTVKMVATFARKPQKWRAKYAKAMVKMGSIEVLTGREGEIRGNCRVVNDQN